MTWASPFLHQETGLVDRARVRGIALFGSFVLTLASGLSYLGAHTWAANWPVLEDGVAQLIHSALFVFFAMWLVVSSFARIAIQRSIPELDACLAAALWTAWGVLGPIRTVSLALFVMAGFAVVAFVRPFIRAARAEKAEHALDRPRDVQSN
ncbi:MAG TPA: hypothetical protein VFX59_01795 [Polyangiales bacterium]|nr:hypothetical protein [Polyangiales bacterium]